MGCIWVMKSFSKTLEGIGSRLIGLGTLYDPCIGNVNTNIRMANTERVRFML